MELKTRNKVAFCIGAFGKDVVYMLITSYLLYYYNTVLKMNASFIGTVLMGARVFIKFYKLNDNKMKEITDTLASRRSK